MNNKSVFDIKEQSLEKLKSLEKLDPDFVFSWLTGLIDLEQKIVAVLYQEARAMVIKDIVSALIYNSHMVKISGHFRDERSFPFDGFYPIPQNIHQKVCEKVDIKQRMDILKSEFKFPSFRRIDKTIQDLITMGIILKREEPSKNKKIKGYYFLNPIIRSQLNKLKKEKI